MISKFGKCLSISSLVLATIGCATLTGGGSSDPVLSEEEVSILTKASPTETCLVTGLVDADNDLGNGNTGIVLASETKASFTFKSGGALDSSVFYMIVPKGSFEIKYLEFSRTKRSDESCWTNNGADCTYTFGDVSAVGKMKNPMPGMHGTLPSTYKGTCEGGFKHLGVYKATLGGLMSSAGFEEMSTGMYQPGERFQVRHFSALREQLKGTSWESLIK